MKLKLQDFALMAEIVGGVAVVISLVYVGLSIRQNTEAIQVANHQSLIAMDMEKNAWLRDSEFVGAYVLARDDHEQLSHVQRQQYDTYIADTLNTWEFAYITHSNGAMEENVWNGFDGFYRTEMTTELFQQFWAAGGENFSPPFQIYVNSVLREQEGGI